MIKIAVYTCIVSNYDKLSNVYTNQDPRVDFICFTDNPLLQYSSGNWNIRSIPEELENLPKVKQQRIIKACPHKYISEYDYTIWIDGNISVISDVLVPFKNCDFFKTFCYTRIHPSRDCIYQEAKKVIEIKRDTLQNVNPQIKTYRDEGFPENWGLHETNILFRKRDAKNSKLFGNFWGSQILKYSHRDQLSFDYCRWKLHENIGVLPIGNLTKDKTFRWRVHGT